MNTDIFYAIVKLVSGEELIAKVCAFEENDEILIVLDDPIIVTLIEIRNVKTPVIKATPWISTSDGTTHVINRNHIITMTEIKDKNIIKIHQQYIRDKNKLSNQTQATLEMGYVSSIKTAREKLEKLYNSQESSYKVEKNPESGL